MKFGFEDFIFGAGGGSVDPPIQSPSSFDFDVDPGHEQNGPRVNIVPPSRAGTQIDTDGMIFEDELQESFARFATGGGDTAALHVDIPSGSLGEGSQAPSEVDTLFSDSGFVSLTACEICKEIYRNLSFRKKHIFKHIKPYTCEDHDCNRHVVGFATTNDRDRHVKSVHKEGDQNWYKCAYPCCAKTTKDHFFDRKDNFTAHIKRCHKELTETGIENLVRISEHKPTAAEVQSVRRLKIRKKPGRFAGETEKKKSKNGGSDKSVSHQGDNASLCSTSPVEVSSSQPLDIPNSTAANSHMFGTRSAALDDSDSIRGGVAMLEPPSPLVPNKGKGRSGQLDLFQQTMHTRSTGMLNGFGSAPSGSAGMGSLMYSNGLPGSSPGELFQAIPQDQYATRQPTVSSLASQLYYSTSVPVMEQGLSTMQGVQRGAQNQQDQPRGGIYPGMTSARGTCYGERVFTPCASTDVSFSQSFEHASQALSYPRSFSSSPGWQDWNVDTVAPVQAGLSSPSFLGQQLDSTMDLDPDLLDLGLGMNFPMETDHLWDIPKG